MLNGTKKKKKKKKILLGCFQSGANWYLNRFVGLSGGEVFHEMMLRLGVKHVCESSR